MQLCVLLPQTVWLRPEHSQAEPDTRVPVFWVRRLLGCGLSWCCVAALLHTAWCSKRQPASRHTCCWVGCGLLCVCVRLLSCCREKNSSAHGHNCMRYASGHVTLHRCVVWECVCPLPSLLVGMVQSMALGVFLPFLVGAWYEGWHRVCSFSFGGYYAKSMVCVCG